MTLQLRCPHLSGASSRERCSAPDPTATLNSELIVHAGLLIPARPDRPVRVVTWSGQTALAHVLSRELGGYDHAPLWGVTPEAGPLTAWVSTDGEGAAENPRLRRLFCIPSRISVRGNALLVDTAEDGRTVGLSDGQADAVRDLLAVTA